MNGSNGYHVQFFQFSNSNGKKREQRNGDKNGKNKMIRDILEPH